MSPIVPRFGDDAFQGALRSPSIVPETGDDTWQYGRKSSKTILVKASS
ncbi:MAG: hypothetical protein ACKVOQ_05255 [Cyclobacteriaceae bacterium]